MKEKCQIQSVILQFLKILIFMIAAGYTLLLLVYMMPVKNIKSNLQESYKLFETEGTYRNLVDGYKDTQLDNWTDATILLETGHEYSVPVYQAALLNTKYKITNLNPTETFIDIYGNSENNDINDIIEVTYSRYWHGYLIFMKPLMTFLNYAQIRYLISFLQTALIAGILVLIGMKKSFFMQFRLFYRICF